MTEIEKFLNEQFTQVITEDKMGIKCLYRHKDRLIDDGVVFFEFAKKKWSKKPIMNKRQFVIVDADMGDVLQFLNQYYNLSEEDFNWLLAELDKPPQVLPGLIELMKRPTPFNLDEPFQTSL